MKHECDRYAREVADLSDVGKRRDQELKRMEDERKQMGEELAKANATKVTWFERDFT